MTSRVQDANHTLRKMARTASTYASTWWSRAHCVRLDLELAKTLVQLHEQRVALVASLAAIDLRTVESKRIAHRLNQITGQINAITKQLGATL